MQVFFHCCPKYEGSFMIGDQGLQFKYIDAQTKVQNSIFGEEIMIVFLFVAGIAIVAACLK
jgi:hypothetical protein